MQRLLALLLGTATTLALAAPGAAPEFQNVPPTLQKHLLGSQLKAARYDAGVLRAQMDKPEVSELVYATFVYHNICAQQWRRPEQFAQLGLKRVELLNASGAQGYAFDARGDICAQMGLMGQNYRTLITQHTTACQAGTCP